MPGPLARLVGINHVALEVGDLDAALEFYGQAFAFELRGRVPGMAFVDMGDQFIAAGRARARRAGEGQRGAGRDAIQGPDSALTAHHDEDRPHDGHQGDRLKSE